MRLPGRLVATVAVLIVALLSGLAVNWGIAAALLIAGLGAIARPMDLFLTMVLITAMATFVNNEGGHLTRELSVLTLFNLYGAFSLLAYFALGRWRLRRSGLGIALFALGVTTTVATVRGVLAQYSLRYIGLEVYPVLALGTALVVGGLKPGLADRRIGLGILIVAGLVHLGLGLDAFVINRTRTGGIFFTDIPGLIALIVLNVYLRARTSRFMFPVALVMCLFLLHQLFSFTRGYWLSLLVSVPFTCVLYAGHWPGARQRWARVGRVAGLSALLLVAGTIVFGVWFGWLDIFPMVAARFASSFALKNTNEAASNVQRLIEHAASARSIASAPWFGHGLGFMLLVRQPAYGILTTQWYVHESYLLMALKQGIAGLLALIAVLVAGFRVGMRGAKHLSGESAGWCAAAAASTLHVSVLAFTNLNFASVNGNFLVALLWGIALAAQTPPTSSIRRMEGRVGLAES